MLPEGMMNTEDKMTIDERRKYLKKMKQRYRKASRTERSELLDEMEVMLGLHRKSLLRLINGSLARKPRQRERSETYKADVTEAIQVIAKSLDYPCAERLTPNLNWMAQHLTKHGELEVTEPLLAQLEQISISTVKRRLSSIRQDQPQRRRRSPRVPNHSLRDVPMGRIAWDVQEPGHFEADLVHHCGPSASGQYAHTLQMVGVTSGWSELRAVLGRSYVVIEDAFRFILERLPFPVREVHPDNGSEFFNDHLRRFWEQNAPEVHLSRSRPYHKNDNPFVEQRNADPIRAYLGYDRLDTVEQIQALNNLYDLMWLYHNFFQPVMRVVEKKVVSEPGQRTRIRRRYDHARTPFDRLCAANAFSPERLAQLTALREETNPRQLRNQIQTQLDYIFSLPCAQPGDTQDVYDTLSRTPDPRRGGKPAR
jgi:hypothetical protein